MTMEHDLADDLYLCSPVNHAQEKPGPVVLIHYTGVGWDVQVLVMESFGMAAW